MSKQIKCEGSTVGRRGSLWGVSVSGSCTFALFNFDALSLSTSLPKSNKIIITNPISFQLIVSSFSFPKTLLIFIRYALKIPSTGTLPTTAPIFFPSLNSISWFVHFYSFARFKLQCSLDEEFLLFSSFCLFFRVLFGNIQFRVAKIFSFVLTDCLN